MMLKAGLFFGLALLALRPGQETPLLGPCLPLLPCAERGDSAIYRRLVEIKAELRDSQAEREWRAVPRPR